MLTGHGGNLREAGERFGIPPDQIIDFSASVNPLGFPPSLKTALKNGLRTVGNYPDPLYNELRKGIGRRHSVSARRILVGNGSTELIHLIPRTLWFSRWLVVSPGYADYADACEKSGKSVRFHYLSPENGFRLDPEKFEADLPDRDAVFLGNPNNPTGTLIDPEILAYLIGRWENVLFVVDEAFLDFVEPPANLSLIHAWMPRNLVVIRSFTKLYGVPGLRLGYAVGSSEFIDRMLHLKEPWTVNCFAEETGKLVLREKDYLKRTRRLVREERKFLYSQIGKLGVFLPYPSTVNFLLIQSLRKGWTGKKIRQMLLSKHRILVRDCANFNGLDPSFFRVAVRTRKENRLLVAALQEISG
jgi:threonine-phosphate decarboxylase